MSDEKPSSSVADLPYVCPVGAGAGTAAVVGASGYLGTHLVPRLCTEGWRVHASSRNRDVLRARHWPDVTLFEADILDPGSLEKALAGADVVFYLVHCMAAGGNFAALERQGASNLVLAAERAGVSRIVYVGGLSPEHPDSQHLQARLETGRLLRAGPTQTVEIRAGMILGPGSAAWEVMRDLVNHLPFMLTPRWVRSKSTPIALEDLLEYLVGVARLPLQGNPVFEVGGPEVCTYEHMMLTYGEMVGKRPRIIAVPLLTPKLSSYWLHLITSVPVNIASALIEGLAYDLIADDRAIRALLPQTLHGFKDAAEAALRAEKAHVVQGRWVEGSLACREWNPSYGFYAKRAGDEFECDVSVEEMWHEILTVGHNGDFFYANTLWRIRRLIDWVLDGRSMRRTRRHPAELRVGDAFDGWRVIGLKECERLTLLMEMKAPGAGVLEFEINPAGQQGSRLRITAYWHPAGVWGMLYWYALLPAHGFLFRGMTRAIVRRARLRPAQARQGG